MTDGNLIPMIIGVAIGVLVPVAAWGVTMAVNKGVIKGGGGGAKRKREFSKIIVTIYAFACIAWIQQDYILAFLFQQPINSQVTITLTTTVVVAIVGYFSKSAFEKNSRNKHGLDGEGKPHSSDTEISPPDTGGSDKGSE